MIILTEENVVPDGLQKEEYGVGDLLKVDYNLGKTSIVIIARTNSGEGTLICIEDGNWFSDVKLKLHGRLVDRGELKKALFLEEGYRVYDVKSSELKYSL